MLAEPIGGVMPQDRWCGGRKMRDLRPVTAATTCPGLGATVVENRLTS
jgi:hypothetical protein